MTQSQDASKPKERIEIVLPFLGSLSSKIKKQMKRIQKQHLPNVNVTIIFKSTNRLSSIFSFKDKLPSYLLSGVVYKYKCSRCNSTYIGKTKRHLHKRFSEHQGRSPLTGKLVKGQCSTTVRDHMLSCDTAVAFSEFEILSRDSNSKSLKITESIFIKKDCPNLNILGESYPLKLFC